MPADVVNTKGMTEARWAYACVQYGEIRRVKNAVAKPRHQCRQDQQRIGRRECGEDDAAGKQGHAPQQHAPSAEAVGKHTSHRLKAAGDNEEQRHHEAKLRITDAKLLLEQREHGRDHELEKMAGEVRNPDQPDGAHIGAQRRSSIQTGTFFSVMGFIIALGRGRHAA